MKSLSEEAKRYLRKNMESLSDEDLERHLTQEAIATEGLDPHTINTIKYELEVVRPWREKETGSRIRPVK